jgi:hypothetical protein
VRCFAQSIAHPDRIQCIGQWSNFSHSDSVTHSVVVWSWVIEYATALMQFLVHCMNGEDVL